MVMRGMNIASKYKENRYAKKIELSWWTAKL